ncbi:MAG: oligosaccharide flippase family protein [Mariniphaga sp.]|nr:oligosaccharide flippase family protein [Mariniphaga sp.]
MAISLVLVPLTIHYINPTQYGIWITLSSIVGWFGFFDIGFGNGLRNKFAEALAKGEHVLARTYVSTTYAILSIIVVIILIIFLCINPLLNWTGILNAPVNLANELSILALIVFVFFCFQFVLQLITTVLTASQQPAKASLLNLIGSLLSLVVIFILTKTTSGSLIYLGISLGLMPVLVLIVSSIWFYTHKYKIYAPALRFVKFGCARDLMSLGLKFFIIQIVFVISYQTSNIIIAQLFGSYQVTSYNIAFKYFGIIPMMMGIVMMPFWSAITEAWIKSDINWIQNAIKKIITLWMLFMILALIMVFCSKNIYKLWIGHEIEIPFIVSASLAAYVIINTWCGIFSLFLNGVGKLRLQLFIGLGGSVVNIPLAIYLGKQIGVSGVVLSTCILSLFGAILLPIQYSKILNKTSKGIWDK